MHAPVPRRRFRCESARHYGVAQHVHRPGLFVGVHRLCASATWHLDLAMHTVHTAAAAGVFLRRVRRLPGLPLTGEISFSRMQQVSQSFPDQPVAGQFGRPQDVPRLRAASVAIPMHCLPPNETER